jgi:hypothetical protein
MMHENSVSYFPKAVQDEDTCVHGIGERGLRGAFGDDDPDSAERSARDPASERSVRRWDTGQRENATTVAMFLSQALKGLRSTDLMIRVTGSPHRKPCRDLGYRPLFPREELRDAGRVHWVSGAPGKLPAYARTDFIVARNLRIASLYLFSTIILEARCTTAMRSHARESA